MYAAINQLQPYMYNNKKVQTTTVPQIIIPIILPVPKVSMKPKCPISDVLLWNCIMILRDDDSDDLCQQSGQNIQQFVTEFRLDLLKRIQTTPSDLKKTNQKITLSIIEQIKSDLLIGCPFRYEHVIAFAAIHKKHVFFVFEHSFFEIKGDNTVTTTNNGANEDEGEKFNQDNGTRYIYMFNKSGMHATSQKELETVLIGKFKIEQYNKVIKGVSSFKLSELKHILDTWEQADQVKQVVSGDSSNIVVTNGPSITDGGSGLAVGNDKKASLYNKIRESIMIESAIDLLINSLSKLR